ncbi:MAG TPA: porin family protein [Draconibacterium sp.]|nr:porin family protein [Draconibacterium sp.]
MKKFILSIFLLLVVTVAFAQRQKVNYLTTFDDKTLHFGFTLGINTLDFAVVNYNPIGDNPQFRPQNWQLDKKQISYTSLVHSDVADLIPGFTVGIISSLRLSRDLNLRFLPGLSFGERKMAYNIDVWDIYNDNPSSYYSIKSTFLDFPLLIKYKARRINNGRPYVVFGTAYRQDISRTAKEDLIAIKKSGFYAELGAGWDNYFLFFRFSIEAKVSLGLNDILGPAPSETQRQYYSQSIKSLRSNIFTLSFNFE